MNDFNNSHSKLKSSQIREELLYDSALVVSEVLEVLFGLGFATLTQHLPILQHFHDLFVLNFS
jgi:hypothetical protein